MSAAPDTSVCQRYERWITAYLDGELDAVHCLEVEDHLETCEVCLEHVQHLQRTRSSLRRMVKTAAPSSLRERVSRTLLAEHEARVGRESEEELPASSRLTATVTMPDAEPAKAPGVLSAGLADDGVTRLSAHLVRLSLVVPLAAAATIALVFGAMRLQNDEAPQPVATNQVTAPSSDGALDVLVNDLVQRHIQVPPLETTNPEDLVAFTPHIGVRVSSPRVEGARWVGARMLHNAALMRYVTQDRRPVTVYVFDSRRVPLQAAQLQARRVGSQRVFVGNVRGVAVAASEQNGIGYALATNSSDEEAARLVLTAAR